MTNIERTCFVIAPIGDAGTELRRRSDQILRHIIEPVVEAHGYRAIRDDSISEPGLITDQVIQHLIDDDLVVADLTGHNPNVFYELAVRHAVRKPVISVIASGEPLPFDVSQSRTIFVDHRDLDSVAHCKAELEMQVRSIEANPHNVSSPISSAIDLRAMRRSENPSERRDAEIISMLRNLQIEVNEIDRRMDALMGTEIITGNTMWRVGDRVHHTKFGIGEVKRVEDDHLTVRFGTHDKHLVPEIAPISRLPEKTGQ